MSKKLSFREVFERRDDARVESREQSDSPVVRLLLTLEKTTQPVDIALLLRKYGMTLRKAHDTLNRLAMRETVATELRTDDTDKLRRELAALGVKALAIRPPAVDVKSIREHFGLSQAEFAIRFGFELDTIQNWEQGRNTPDQPTQLLLKVIEAYPQHVEAVLTKGERGAAVRERR